MHRDLNENYFHVDNFKSFIVTVSTKKNNIMFKYVMIA